MKPVIYSAIGTALDYSDYTMPWGDSVFWHTARVMSTLVDVVGEDNVEILVPAAISSLPPYPAIKFLEDENLNPEITHTGEVLINCVNLEAVEDSNFKEEYLTQIDHIAEDSAASLIKFVEILDLSIYINRITDDGVKLTLSNTLLEAHKKLIPTIISAWQELIEETQGSLAASVG